MTRPTPPPPRAHPQGPPTQLAFDDLQPPLRGTTFVVVDLETTGTSSAHDAITEIAAVRVREGVVLGEFATLVNPGADIPPYIIQITGITSQMVIGAPKIGEVLPAFDEFIHGAVLVAHNAPFDVGFLKAAYARHGLPWPAPEVLCTVTLARRVLTRDEAPSVRLSALAQALRVPTTPTHRALDDARATVEVLHALIERVGNLGIHSLTELTGFNPRITARQRAKHELAQHLPQTPGVYLFRGPGGEVLYIGKAAQLRRRVRSYFTSAETRGRITEMVELAQRVDYVECAHEVEAGVRELRLIAAHNPPYNRKSRWPQRSWWLTLTEEAFPRLTATRSPTAAHSLLGPFPSRANAAGVAATIAQECGLRTCGGRIAATGTHGPRCPPTDIGGCPASRRGLATPAQYARAVHAAAALIAGTDSSAFEALIERVAALAAAERFEQAARLRDTTCALGRALVRSHRLTALCAVAELVAAHPDGAGGWHLAVIRHGSLAAAGNAPRGVPPLPVADALTAAAHTPPPGSDTSPLRGTLAEEVRLIERWLTDGTTRIVRSSTGYSEPARGVARFGPWLDHAAASTTLPSLYQR